MDLEAVDAPSSEVYPKSTVVVDPELSSSTGTEDNDEELIGDGDGEPSTFKSQTFRPIRQENRHKNLENIHDTPLESVKFPDFRFFKFSFHFIYFVYSNISSVSWAWRT